MDILNISNVAIKGLKPLDFFNHSEYKRFGINNGTNTLVSMYQELLRETLGNKVDEVLIDYELNKVETKQIRETFEQKIDDTLPLAEPLDKRRYKSWTFEWKSKKYDLNLSLISPNSLNIKDFYRIVEICDECLAENKPMYLSIEENPA